MKNKIGIMGAGWLGMPLATHLNDDGFNVFVLSRSLEKLTQCEDVNIPLYSYAESKMLAPHCDVLICCIPPIDSYADFVIKHVKNVWPNHVVFCSSISVYAQTEGVITEKSESLGNTTLIAVEKALIALKIPTTILRLGGLIGPSRHPAYFFAGKKNLSGGLAPVNLIHQQDVISLIKTLLTNRKPGIYNVVYPAHPTRKSYYEQACFERGLAPCTFESAGTGKWVDGNAIVTDLKTGYSQPI